MPIQLNGKTQYFEVDSGARFTLLSRQDFENLNLNLPLQPSSIVFRAYNGSTIKPCGKIIVNATYGDKKITSVLHVVPDGSQLLGREWIRLFNINLQQIDRERIQHKSSLLVHQIQSIQPSLLKTSNQYSSQHPDNNPVSISAVIPTSIQTTFQPSFQQTFNQYFNHHSVNNPGINHSTFQQTSSQYSNQYSDKIIAIIRASTPPRIQKSVPRSVQVEERVPQVRIYDVPRPRNQKAVTFSQPLTKSLPEMPAEASPQSRTLPVLPSPVERRPQRQRKTPARFNDYVVYK